MNLKTCPIKLPDLTLSVSLPPHSRRSSKLPTCCYIRLSTPRRQCCTGNSLFVCQRRVNPEQDKSHPIAPTIHQFIYQILGCLGAHYHVGVIRCTVHSAMRFIKISTTLNYTGKFIYFFIWFVLLPSHCSLRLFIDLMISPALHCWFRSFVRSIDLLAHKKVAAARHRLCRWIPFITFDGYVDDVTPQSAQLKLRPSTVLQFDEKNCREASLHRKSGHLA